VLPWLPWLILKMAGLLHHVVVEVYRRFRYSCCSLIALMMEAVRTSETSVNFYQTTRCNNAEDSHLHTRRRENLKSHMVDFVTMITLVTMLNWAS
jgi:nucleoside diphosphate kinase